MLRFGKASRERLKTIVPELQALAIDALAVGVIDFTVTDGRRSRERQQLYYETGRSKVMWPHSRHNVLQPYMLAEAMDLTPYVNGRLSYNKAHCCVLAGVVLTLAKRRKLEIRWGGNWDMDLEPVTDQDFQDLVHFELYSPRRY